MCVDFNGQLATVLWQMNLEIQNLGPSKEKCEEFSFFFFRCNHCTFRLMFPRGYETLAKQSRLNYFNPALGMILLFYDATTQGKNYC